MGKGEGRATHMHAARPKFDFDFGLVIIGVPHLELPVGAHNPQITRGHVGVQQVHLCQEEVCSSRLEFLRAPRHILLFPR
jgi:hypothetical protein